MAIRQKLLRGALGWLVAGAALVGGTANAAVITQTLNVGGILSNEELGSAQNEVRFLNFAGAQVRVIGLSWDVDLYADSPSWLSEISVDLSSPLGGLALSPGFGDDNPGTGSYSSAGFVDLVGLGADFLLDATGNLRFEFFESFNDFASAWDGQWRSGNITVRVDVVPEPATAAMVLLALGALGANSRRRKPAA